MVAAAVDSVSGQRFRARLCPDHGEVLGWLGGLPGTVAVAYEAGPTGFVLARALRAAGIRCEVLAPSRLQRPAGDRIKTDSRDAMHLAKLLRLDEFVPVRVPAADEEAARDLVRAREDARGDVMRARHRVSKLLLRQGIVYYGGGTWTEAHHRWLRQQRLGLPATQIAYEGAYETVVLTEARRDRLDVAITAMAAEPGWAPMVAKLSCLRGISTLTAFALAVEIGDWYRFTGSSIGAYLGLVPSEFSSGAKRSQGPITKTGNGHARRLLVEAAWHHRRPYRAPGVTLRARWNAAPAAARTRGHAGNTRLHARWQCFRDRKKPTVVANVAIARELAGWCWSLATLPD